MQRWGGTENNMRSLGRTTREGGDLMSSFQQIQWTAGKLHNGATEEELCRVVVVSKALK